MDRVEILGIKIDNLSLQEILEKAKQFLASHNKYYIVTPNPEFLVAAKKDKNFAEILNYADIAIADGFGLVWAAKKQGQKLQRITGVDLMWHLCELAAEKNYPIYLFGAEEGIAKRVAELLLEYFPHLKIVGSESGGEVSSDGKITEDQRIITKINEVKPKIIFVALGQIKQEKWIFRHLDQLTSVKIAMGVGGAFDFISGNINRAPELLRNLGLEWLYRLIKEPRRWRRIFNAVIVFPLLILKQRIFKK
ncbi:MAG: hypothetical protein A2731_01960 [Candidatus Buchananbacteria bacterium RIFCSPHIGHO2_01_FULL_39_8]|uniref:Uncharacterized protein n=1 Tax=Candidatus Buchananbacteria bacterium RIFCSPHIGHO2_01_FULL_39_8 TaxID=1797533 RepID=A0A1G1Y0K2_9BACT|nr:hypothetical protein [uncultured bacterium]OGY45865.1 MAG: hypothetical protein A2731_01960 [Candidatus Buchananbacteria bacterium RIFCSPHIGHO2_01_FULL_39_8]